ncbi:4a-hydroxytetrahydrobiopterin dehydratase [Bacteroidota bacterium]
MAVLPPEKINEKLNDLNGWNFKDNHIGKLYELNNFKEALDMVCKIGEAAERMNHHPDIYIHSWNKVKITISTHSEGGVTEKDFILAKRIEGISNETR